MRDKKLSDASSALALMLFTGPAVVWFNASSHNKFLDWSKLKAFADDNLNVNKN